MPIETICPGCSRKLRVGDEFAGKQARCPVCNEIYVVSGDRAATGRGLPDQNTWRLKTPEGQIYGPVAKDELDQWVSDGRVTADCFIAPDESRWERADDFYPVLKEVATTPGSANFGTPNTRSPNAGPSNAGQIGATPQGSGPFASAPSATGRAHYRYTAAHRGGLILALAVISWVVGCPIFGLFAWIMGSGDLREMRLGRMDPSGMGMTQAGQIIGMIHSILVIIGFVIFIFVMMLVALGAR